MNNSEYELQAKLLKLKRFLSSVSDISYSYGILKSEAQRNNIPVETQVEKLNELVEQARQLLTAKGESYGANEK